MVLPGPQVQVHILAFEFEPAGAFRFRYRFPDGSESTVKGAYRSIEPAQQLAFSWEWEEPDRHAGIETEVEISFVACGDDTEVIVRHDRLPDAASRDRYTSGWTTYLDRLAAYVGADDSR